MKPRNPRNTALGDALKGAIRSADQFSVSSKTGDIKEHENNTLFKDVEVTGSAALDRLHLELSDASHQRDPQLKHLIPLAREAGRRGMNVRPRDNEMHMTERLIKVIGDSLLYSSVGRIERIDMVLAMACLTTTPNTKKYFQGAMVNAISQQILPSSTLETLSRERHQGCLLDKTISARKVEWEVNRIRKEIYEKQKAEELAEYIRLQAIEQKKREHIKRAKAELDQIIQKLTKTSVNPEIRIAFLKELDIKLIAQWGNLNSSDTQNVDLRYLRKRLNDFELTRLCSARYAELAAAEYYQQLGASVQDVSVTQLIPAATEWVTHDLLVNQRPIDVKNARQSFSSPSSYSEFLVPQFKNDRVENKEVAIAAVLSRYMKADDILQGITAECTMLGEVTQTELDTLSTWTRSEFNGLMVVGKLSTGWRLPGWCFEFVDSEAQNNRNVLDQSIQYLVDKVLRSKLLRDEIQIPLPIMVFTGNEDQTREVWKMHHNGEIPAGELELFRLLVKLRKTIGISRRSLFIFVVAQTLLQIQRNEDSWTPASFKSWLFFNNTFDTKRYWPLGQHDPLGYIVGIINAMVKLWETSQKQLSQVKLFNLTSPWILKGIMDSGVEQTILSYCGGWKKINEGVATKCGLSPLVLGLDKNCHVCGRLKCRECGYCSEQCDAK